MTNSRIDPVSTSLDLSRAASCPLAQLSVGHALEENLMSAAGSWGARTKKRRRAWGGGTIVSSHDAAICSWSRMLVVSCPFERLISPVRLRACQRPLTQHSTHNVAVPRDTREPGGDDRRAILNRHPKGCENSVDVRDERRLRETPRVHRPNVRPRWGQQCLYRANIPGTSGSSGPGFAGLGLGSGLPSAEPPLQSTHSIS